ncbi:MAG: DNA mismatch repair endonuclease MutL [Oscillospiraceae bacterium]|nr:DNA mismatch repair endonuclease MutL [Oscillospiraceae bacterium]
MPKVKLLTKETAELIAAGEVIERPASIVKELIENAVDSGADSISVEIKQGGVSYIRITDNGCGIPHSDVPTAFLRHATSKISDKHDLDRIQTLGFRGEALASVCAVARVELLTKTSDEELGTHYIIEGSEEVLYERCGCPDGTTIIVRALFYNVPARLKFLKKDVSEGNAIADITGKIAVSHPEISFRFTRDNKRDFFTAGDSELYSAVYAVFGKQLAASMLPVDYELNGVKIEGFTIKPMFGRHNRAHQIFFLNGRYVKAYAFTGALEEAYKNYIASGKFPACVLRITMPPHLFDVNVHPAKVEVRFADEYVIRDSLFFAVKNALLLDSAPAEIKLPETERFVPDYKIPTSFEPAPEYNQIKINTINDNPYQAPSAQKNINNETNAPPPQPSAPHSQLSALSPQPPTFNSPLSTLHSIIGEAFGNYIIAQADDGIIIADKHAAHERIIFERLKSGEQTLECQLLFSPAKVELSEEEITVLNEKSALLEKLGFSFTVSQVEGSKTNTIFINGIPSILDGFDAGALFEETIRNVCESRQNPMPAILDGLYHMVSCKSAVKAGDSTGLLEMEHIIKALLENEHIRYCPHGRPIMFKLTKRELEKHFKRS